MEFLSDWVARSIVEQAAMQIGIERFGAHDLQRTCARLCRKSGGNMDQIESLFLSSRPARNAFTE